MVQVKRRQSKFSPLLLQRHKLLLVILPLMVGAFVIISLLLQPSSPWLSSSSSGRDDNNKAKKLLKGRKQILNGGETSASDPDVDSVGKKFYEASPQNVVGDNKHRLVDFVVDGETIELRSASMPAIGYGTCCRKTAKGDDIYKSTLVYIKEGGRLIDTAMAYGNHKEIGQAIKDSTQIITNRNQIWITSKISPNKLPNNKILKNIADSTVTAVKGIIEELNFIGNDAYLDLCLIHTQKLGKERTIEIWKGLIQAQKQGYVKVIGVSNFNKFEIMDLYEATNVMPEINQIQFHPWTEPEWKETVKWQHQNHIATTAYTSLGGSRFHSTTTTNNKGNGDSIINSHSNPSYPPIVSELATKYGATEAQVLLRWALQQNVAIIPGSASPTHIKENLNIPNFILSNDEMQLLESSNSPINWWDPKRGPNKYLGEEATTQKIWQGDHTISSA